MDNAKQVTKALLLTALVITTAFSGALVANIIIGNLLEKDVTVPTDAVTLSYTDVNLVDTGVYTTDYGACPDNPVRGITYDMGVLMHPSSSIDGVVVQFEITMMDISITDVTVMYYDPADMSWSPLAFTDLGNVLTCTIGPAEGFSLTEGVDQTAYFQVTYNTSGSYMTDLWPEALA